MAADPNDWNKRLAALQNKKDPDSIKVDDLNNRLGALKAAQKKDVNPNATNNELWDRLNNLDSSAQINPYNQTGVHYQNKQFQKNSKLAEHQTDALLNQIGDELNLDKSAPKGIHSFIHSISTQFCLSLLQ